MPQEKFTRAKLLFRQSPREQNAPAASEYILTAIELIRRRRTHDRRSRSSVPKRFAVTRIDCQEVAHGVASERQAGVCREHAGSRSLRSQFMAPADGTRLVV